MSLAGILVLGYDGAVMRRDVHLAMVAFWTSVPMFAVCLAFFWSGVYWPLGWLGALLWAVVVSSSAYLTVLLWSFPLVKGERGGLRHRATSEALVYLVVFCLACLAIGLQLMTF
jgi:hypothetical protein